MLCYVLDRMKNSFESETRHRRKQRESVSTAGFLAQQYEHARGLLGPTLELSKEQKRIRVL